MGLEVFVHNFLLCWCYVPLYISIGGHWNLVVLQFFGTYPAYRFKRLSHSRHRT